MLCKHSAAFNDVDNLVKVRRGRIQAVRKRNIVDHVAWRVLVIQKLLNQDINVSLLQRGEPHLHTQALLELRHRHMVDHVTAVLVMGSIIKERLHLHDNVTLAAYTIHHTVQKVCASIG